MRIFSAAGFCLSIAAAALSLGVFLAGVPALRFGHWPQSEPTLAALHATAALAALGIALQLLAKSRPALKAVMHPVVAAPAAMGLLSAALAPFALSPALTLLGLPQTGNAALWYFDVACLAACGVLASRAGYARCLAVFGVAATVGMLVLNSSGLAAFSLAVLPLREFAAFAVLGAAMAYGAAFRPQGLRFAVMCVLTGIGLGACRNITALAALGGGLVVGLCVGWAAPGGRLRPRVAAGLVAFAPVAATAAHLVATSANWLPQTWGFSLYSRLEAFKVAGQALRASPERLLVGFGWGAFPEVVIANARAVAGPLDGLGEYGPLVWEGLREPFFQTFNVYLEATLSLGLAGLVGLLGWIWLAARFCPRRIRLQTLPFLAALAVLWTAWFDFPSTVPMLALGFAGIAGPVKMRRFGRWPALALLGAVLCGQCLAVAVVLRDAGFYRLEAELVGQATPEAMSRLCAPGLFPWPDRGGYAEAVLLENATRDVRKNPKYALAFLSRLCRVRHLAAEPHASLRLCEAYLRALGRLAWELPDPMWNAARAAYLPDYARAARRVLELAPGRSELAVGYLLWSVDKDPAATVDMAARILRAAPQDPVGQFFLGVMMLNGTDPDRQQEGVERLRQARDGGLARFLDMGDALTRRIE